MRFYGQDNPYTLTQEFFLKKNFKYVVLCVGNFNFPVEKSEYAVRNHTKHQDKVRFQDVAKMTPLDLKKK